MATNWQVGDRIQNRWKIHKILRGGMGIVYVVYDHELREAFAAKTFQDEIFARNSATADRFTQEALTWINLDLHNNVTQARFVEKIGGKPYLFLEYVTGGDLGAWIGTRRLTEDLPQVLKFAIQFCDGMAHALSKGLQAHRDIKPQNCLVTHDCNLKITDFGLAKVFDQFSKVSGPSHKTGQENKPGRGFLRSLFRGRHPNNEDETEGLNVESLRVGLTRTGMAAGTWTHMAPEQFDDAKHVDVRADIYSFGVMLYQMLTGQLPFVGQTCRDFERLHKTQTPRLPITLPSSLSCVLKICLAKHPAHRFTNFVKVREQLVDIYEKLAGQSAPHAITETQLTVAQWNYKAMSLCALGRAEEALVCVNRALVLNPETDLLWTNKGIALRSLGEHQEALACHDRSIEINPQQSMAWHNKGNALQDLNRHEEACGCYDRALALNPRLDRSWSNKGNSLVALGQHREAGTCYDRAIALNPRYEMAWCSKGTVLDALGQPNEAIACYNQVLNLNPYLALGWFNKGNSLGKAGKYKEALGCFDQALSINRSYAEALYGKGVALTALAQIESALACFSEAVSINPLYAEAWTNKSGLLGGLGQYEKALACSDRALELNPGLGQAWMNKGAALGGLGRTREGLSCFEKAHQLGHPQAAKAIGLFRGMPESQ